MKRAPKLTSPCKHCGARTRRHPDGLCWTCRILRLHSQQNRDAWRMRRDYYRPQVNP